MGQKVNPNGFRIGVTKRSHALWYKKDSTSFVNCLKQDIKLRSYILSKYANAGIAEIVIERLSQSANINIRCVRPGIIIGRKGSDIDTLRHRLSELSNIPVHVTVEEQKKPELEAKLVAENIAGQLERRVQFRKAMKKAIQSTMRAGARGIRVMVSGRVGGAEIARSEAYREGRVPLHTIRADIDYHIAEAQTTYGIIGVKVWVYRGDKLALKEHDEQESKVN